METIRVGTFETNSSSTHSIVVNGNKFYDHLEQSPIKVKPDWGYGFGWQFETWDTIEQKLAYMVRCLVCYDYNANSLQDKIRPIQERLHNLGIDFELPTYEEYIDGYVDHEDWYQMEIENIYKDDNELLDFLLNSSSYIEGGNDNC